MTTYLVLEPGTTLTIPCNVTMEGSLHSASFSKIRGALIGYITRASVNTSSCREGTVAFLSERLPWHIRYDVYAGILPNITRVYIQFIGLAIQAGMPGVVMCLATSSPENPMTERIELEGPLIRQLASGEEIRIPTAFAPLCENARITYEGEGSVTSLGTTTRVTLLLI